MYSGVFASDGRLYYYAIVATLKYDYIAAYAVVQSVVRSGAHRNESIDKEEHICSPSVAAHYTLWCRYNDK